MKATAQLNGRLGSDANIKTFENGNSVIQLEVASNSYYRDKNGELQENTSWHTIKIFVKEVKTEFTDMLVKGTVVAGSGYLMYDEYEDKKESNQKRAYIDVRLVDFQAYPSGKANAD